MLEIDFSMSISPFVSILKGWRDGKVDRSTSVICVLLSGRIRLEQSATTHTHTHTQATHNEASSGFDRFSFYLFSSPPIDYASLNRTFT